eukprot:1274731-Prymnesium_polylepis.1
MILNEYENNYSSQQNKAQWRSAFRCAERRLAPTRAIRARASREPTSAAHPTITHANSAHHSVRSPDAGGTINGAASPQ